MKAYTSGNPVFSSSIQIPEASDRAHADNINAATKQLLQNTLVNRRLLEELMELSYDEMQELLFISGTVGNVDESEETLYMTGNSPSSGGGGEYELPAATRERLGGVKIGDGIALEGDGTISVDGKTLVDESIASESDVQEMLSSVFGKDI